MTSNVGRTGTNIANWLKIGSCSCNHGGGGGNIAAHASPVPAGAMYVRGQKILTTINLKGIDLPLFALDR